MVCSHAPGRAEAAISLATARRREGNHHTEVRQWRDGNSSPVLSARRRPPRRSCFQRDRGPAADPIKIGGIFAITGPTSDVGADYAVAAKDAIAYINANGG